MTNIPYNKCLSLTGYTPEDLIALTGVYAIHPEAEFLDWLNRSLINYWIVYNDQGELSVIIQSPEVAGVTIIEELTVIVKSATEIYNAVFILYPTARNSNGNYGFKRLREEIRNGISLGFDKITLWAYGNYSLLKDWSGYLIWGKYGFLMYKPDEISVFDSQMSEDKLQHCTNINHVVLSKEGTAYWKHTGWDWHGEFLLKTSSPSRRIFKAYGVEKGLI
ncbi:MAG: hypothetical protein JSR97_01250 [Verrucomicrobia bacterium]|nr:hypothetical protein [Verrucomicrobiota bacterium]